MITGTWWNGVVVAFGWFFVWLDQPAEWTNWHAFLTFVILFRLAFGSTLGNRHD